MKTYKKTYRLLVAALLYIGVLPFAVYGAQPNISPPVAESEEVPPGQRIGAPQVLEISPQSEEASSATRTQPQEISPPLAPARTVERAESPVIEQPARTVERLPQQRENFPSG